MDDKQSRRMERLLKRVLEVLGDTYDEVAYLNEGGMGAVFTGRHKRLKRVDAIKVLYVDGPAAEDALDRFRGEWQTIAALGRCPHIVSIYEADHDEERDLAWLTEEYVDGPSLKERMAGGRLPVSEALDIGVQIASGLLYAHERGVIHRDIKPGNIIVDQSGDTLLTDFGLARFQGDDRLTQTHMAVGTLAFMSPEALSGADPAPAMDVYSLGVVLFEMFTGQRLFGGANIIQQQMSEAPRDPRTLAPDLPEGLSTLILAMLAKTAGERPSAGEVVQQLEAVRAAPPPRIDTTIPVDVTDGAIPKTPAAAGSTPTKTGSKRWLLVGSAVVTAVAVFLGMQLMGPNSTGDATTGAATGNPTLTATQNSPIDEDPDPLETQIDPGDSPGDSPSETPGESTSNSPGETEDNPSISPPDPTPALPAEITLQVGVAGEYRRQVQSFRILVNGEEIGDRPGMYSIRRPPSGRLTVSLQRLAFMFAPAETTVTLGTRSRVELEFVPSPY